MEDVTAALTAVEGMDNDEALEFILSQGREKFDKPVRTEKPITTKMMSCHDCPDKSRRNCFKCMDEFYSHMHDDRGKPVKVEVEQVRLVRNPITGKRYDPKHRMKAVRV